MFFPFFFFFLILNSYFLIHAVNVHIFNPTAELAGPRGTPAIETNAKIKTHPRTVETQIRKCSNCYPFFNIFHSLTH